MLDLQLLRNNLVKVEIALKRRGYNLDANKFTALEQERKQLQVQVQELQSQRNNLAKQIGLEKTNHNIDYLLSESKQINTSLQLKKDQQDIILQQLNELLLNIPNIPDEFIPNDNFHIEREEGIKPTFYFTPKDHVELGAQLKGINFEQASKIAGSRFVVLSNNIARLHRALIQFMMDIHVQNGYEEVYVPYLVNRDSLIGTGQLPKFEDDLFKVNDYYLIPTGEVPVTNLLRNTVTLENQLPLKYVTHTPCFRSEAGSSGKDTRGMIRQHQFEKVELVQAILPEHSDNAHNELTSQAELILQLLELPYRVITLPANDIGFSASKTIDLEVWLPSQNTYREISSCTNFRDFQARRMNAKYKRNGKNEYLHTINGSGLAVGRTLVAIMENYQTVNGSIIIPDILIPYMNGLEVICNP